jgi:hypothetical protein
VVFALLVSRLDKYPSPVGGSGSLSSLSTSIFDPEGGIAITPVANTEYHPLIEGGGATGCGIDTKVELR